MILELKKREEGYFDVFHKGVDVRDDICERGAAEFGLSEGKYRVAAKNPKEKGFNKITIKGVVAIKPQVAMVIGWSLLSFLARQLFNNNPDNVYWKRNSDGASIGEATVTVWVKKI